MGKDLFQKLNEIIEANINDPKFGAAELANKMGLSYKSLQRKTASLPVKSINHLIRQIRMKKAWELLQDESLTASEVAFRTGFSSSAYFNTAFHDFFGYPPGEAREKGIANIMNGVNGVAGEQNSVPGKKVKWMRRLAIAGIAVILVAVGALISLTSFGWFREEKSLAVLPFLNISQDTLGEVFCEVIWDQVIVSVQKINVFDVRSGVSSGQYRHTEKSIPEIGRELNAAFIIEGSVGLEGDQATVKVQLIDAKTDTHLWEHEYLFKLDKTYDQLSNITQHIAYNLMTKVLPWEKSALRVRGTTNCEAWNSYNQGNYWMDTEHGIDPSKAVPCYRRAIELDSLWPDPYLGLAFALEYGFYRTHRDDYLQERLKAIEKANELRPEPETYWLLVRYYLDVGDFKKSKHFFRKALKVHLNDLNVQDFDLPAYRIFGRWKAAEKRLLKCNQVNPKSVLVNLGLADTYVMRRDFPKALKYFNQAMAVGPEFSLIYYSLADTELKWEGDTREARKIIEDANKRNPWIGWDTMRAQYQYVMIDIYEGAYQEALQELSRWPQVHPKAAPPNFFRPKYLLYAWVYGYQNHPYLEHAYYDSTRIYIEEQQQKYPWLKKEPTILSCLGMAWAGLGNAGKAHEMADRVVDILSASSLYAYNGIYAMEDVAWIHAKTGQFKEAFKILRKLLSKRGQLTIKLLELDPKWEPLRKLSDFKKLRKKYADA